MLFETINQNLLVATAISVIVVAAALVTWAKKKGWKKKTPQKPKVDDTTGV